MSEIRRHRNTNMTNKNQCHNMLQTIPAKKSAALDVEPVYTFRAHTGKLKIFRALISICYMIVFI